MKSSFRIFEWHWVAQWLVRLQLL